MYYEDAKVALVQIGNDGNSELWTILKFGFSKEAKKINGNSHLLWRWFRKHQNNWEFFWYFVAFIENLSFDVTDLLVAGQQNLGFFNRFIWGVRN